MSTVEAVSNAAEVVAAAVDAVAVVRVSRCFLHVALKAPATIYLGFRGVSIEPSKRRP